MALLLPEYIHIINPKLKYIYLSFDAQGRLVIKSPKVSQREIEKVLLKKAAWISKSRQKLLEKKGKPLQFTGDETLYFLGDGYPVHYEQWSKKKSFLRFDKHQGFTLSYFEFDAGRFEALVNRFYKDKAQQMIPELVQRYADTMQLTPSKVSFRKARSRWGSCSNTNAISFNYYMMKLPMAAIEYIIVHELAHIRHKHHQRAFWDLVSLHLPDYKQQQNELKNYL
ncbi:MAG TPA: M48 family peptidase [Epsilonproteobacteria bacterium]|nr:M48 family peptidase [Campylobacterota bacterium]